jgi:site-specific recombinase XerD
MSVTPDKDYPGIWIIRWYPEGRKKDPKTGKPSNKRSRMVFEGTHAEALAQYADLLRTTAKQTVSLAPTLEKAFPEFLAHYKTTVEPGTIKDFLVSWEHLTQTFGKFRFNYITPQIITQYKTRRLEEGVKPRTITKEISYLSSFCAWAALPEINYANPITFAIKGFSAKQCQPPPTYLLSDMEIESLIEYIRPEKRTILLMYVDMGLRRCEALNIKGLDFDAGRRLLRVYGKGNKEVWLPIPTARVFQALEGEKKKHGDEHLFLHHATGKPFLDCCRAIRAAAKRAKITKRVHNHLLRHNFATRLLESGVDIHVVQILMRHANIATTMKYIHANTQFVLSELSKYTESVEPVAPPEPTKPPEDSDGGALHQNYLRIVK